MARPREWFEVHGETATALEHWLAAGRPEDALRLAVDVGFALVDRGQAVTIEAIARRIPPSVPAADPARQLAYGLLHMVFEPETFLGWVGHATATIEALAEPDDGLLTQYLTVRSMADISTGAWDDAFDHATRALTQAHVSGDAAGYGRRARLQVIRAAGWLERLADAEHSFTACIDDPRTPEPLRAMVAPAAWALAAAIGGRIDDADHWSHRAAAAADLGYHSMFSTQDLLLASAMIARERGDDGAAADALEQLCGLEVKPNFSLHAIALVELAEVRLDQGRVDDAADALDAALHVRVGKTLGPPWSVVWMPSGRRPASPPATRPAPAGLPSRCPPACGSRSRWPACSSSAASRRRPTPCWSRSRRRPRASAWPSRCSVRWRCSSAIPSPRERTPRRRPASRRRRACAGAC